MVLVVETVWVDSCPVAVPVARVVLEHGWAVDAGTTVAGIVTGRVSHSVGPVAEAARATPEVEQMRKTRPRMRATPSGSSEERNAAQGTRRAAPRCAGAPPVHSACCSLIHRMFGPASLTLNAHAATAEQADTDRAHTNAPPSGKRAILVYQRSRADRGTVSLAGVPSNA